MQRRRIAIATIALLACIAAVRHPTASIEVLTHDAADLRPHRVKAALDLGLVGVDLLVTWTSSLR